MFIPRKIYLLLILFVLFSLFPITFIGLAQSYDYSEGDYFKVKIKTSLTGNSGEYVGYTEKEEDIRTYQVLSANSTVVEWRMSRNFHLTSNEGDYISDRSDYYFSTDPITRQYLDSSIDGPDSNRDYYTFDYMWFRIDPNLQSNKQITILNNTYVVRGKSTIKLDRFTAVDVIKVELLYPPISKTVYNADYDPYIPAWRMTTTSDAYYFDIKTGYLVKYDWRAYGTTSVGKFSWFETALVTESSYDFQYNQGAVIASFIPHFLLIIIIIIFIFCFFYFRRKLWERHVTRAMNVISGSIPPPIKDYSSAPSLWDPLQLEYSILLEGLGEPDKHSLNQGIFVIIDTNNRLAITSIQQDINLPNQVFPSKEENIKFFLRLALGLVNPHEIPFLRRLGKNLTEYSHFPVDGFALIDKLALETFALSPEMMNPEYEEIAYLLSRRRVLDYSSGQAPLSPNSHLKKLNEILSHNPKEVFLVGDDDLISISLARRGIKVSLVEIDPYTCALIAGIGGDENLPIKIMQHDLRMPFPKDFSTEFDLFVADPDFTIEAFALFLTRGLSRLCMGGIGLINFENKRGQLFRARYLLKQLQVEVVTEHKDRWRYVILRN
ncbi:MAG: bis-aminopropyl spermidine synthase family protein, partial [Candidatus Hodarchaeales archaeon]